MPPRRGRGRRPQGHCCYLLRSEHRPGRTYIGFTVDPVYRLRQHNGEVTGGARATRPLRPWVHVAVVRGFPGAREALSFEWHWKNSQRSRRLRGPVRGQTVTGPRGRLYVLDVMLRTEPWSAMPLEVERGAGAILPPPRVPGTVPALRRTLERLEAVLASDAVGANARADVETAAVHWRAMVRDYDAAAPGDQAVMRAQLTALHYDAEARRERYARARAQSAAAPLERGGPGADAGSAPAAAACCDR